MFKHASLFNFTAWHPLQAEQINAVIEAATFTPCTASQEKSSGWVEPQAGTGLMVEQVDRHLILRFAIETKTVPAATIKRRADEIAEQIEKQTGRKPGRKQFKELKEQALHELLPMAFSKLKHVMVWIDTQAGRLLIDTASAAVAEDVVTALVRAIDGLAVSLVLTETSPSVAMAHWLGTGDAPYGFTIDRECELKSTDEMKAVVRYARHPLDIDEVRQHITAGKVPTKLALTWRDRVSFVLTDSLTLTKLDFLDVVFEGKAKGGQQGDFFADVALLSGELVELIEDLLDALGGAVEQREGVAA